MSHPVHALPGRDERAGGAMGPTASAGAAAAGKPTSLQHLQELQQRVKELAAEVEGLEELAAAYEDKPPREAVAPAFVRQAMPSVLGRAMTLGVGARDPVEPAPSGPPPSAHAPQLTSEDGSDDGHDSHGYTGPEPEDWSTAFFINFLGNASPRYKLFVIASLVINPFLLLLPHGKLIAGWFFLAEFLATLALSLQAYPLQPGGLLLIEANIMGVTNPKTLLHEVEINLNVLLMLIFMVAAIHFLKSMLLWLFTNMLIKIENKIALSLTFMLTSALMSAFLDALTVVAVIISVTTGFLGVYYFVEKNSFLPLLNRERRNEMSFELVPQAMRHPSRDLEDEVKEILARPGFKPVDLPVFDEINEEDPAQHSHIPLQAIVSLDIVRKNREIDLPVRSIAEVLDPTSRGSLELVRHLSMDHTRGSLELESMGHGAGRASSPRAGSISLDSPKPRPETKQSRKSSKLSWLSRSFKKPSPEQEFDNIEVDGTSAMSTAQSRKAVLRERRFKSENDANDGPRSTIAEHAMLPDGHFDVPNLKHVLANRIVQPRLPEEHCRTQSLELDVRHIEHDVDRFKAFLRSIIMHSAVGTTVGGIFTMVGEPQNLIVAKRMQWDFGGFVYQMLPVSLTVLPAAILVLVACEKTGRFGYGAELPDEVRWVLADFADKEFGRMKRLDKAKLIAQVFGALLLIVGLFMHFAEVGFIGLLIVVVVTSLNGVTVEHEIAHAFLESMPFVSLLVVFLGIVGMIHDQHMFDPIITGVLALEDKAQIGVLFIVNGMLSAVSDNVFVATVFVEQLEKAFIVNGTFVESRGGKQQYNRLGTAIIAGTNLPSMATPNGQAALLFILTSSIAPLIHLSYRRMMVMTLPYLLVCSSTGVLACLFWQWGM